MRKPNPKPGPRSMLAGASVSAATVHRLSDHLFAQSPDFKQVDQDYMRATFPVDKNYDGNCWAQIRDEIIRAFARERPGTRPRAFWKFDAPKPGLTVHEDCTMESQAHFLHRHDLLLPGEAARLKPEDFEPKPVPIVDDDADDYYHNDGCQVCGWAHVRAVMHGEEKHEV